LNMATRETFLPPNTIAVILLFPTKAVVTYMTLLLNSIRASSGYKSRHEN